MYIAYSDFNMDLSICLVCRTLNLQISSKNGGRSWRATVGVSIGSCSFDFYKMQIYFLHVLFTLLFLNKSDLTSLILFCFDSF